MSRQKQMISCSIKTPLGIAIIEGDSNGISSFSITDEIKNQSNNIPELLLNCTLQLQEYFEGTRKSFNLKLNPQGTDFQKKVWTALQDIPYGKTVSYLKLSNQIGDSKAIRAVANASAKNPLWIFVPCHRVIGSDGSLTGYAGGLHRKQWLLNHESPNKQGSLF